MWKLNILCDSSPIHILNCCLKSTHCIKYCRGSFSGVANQMQTEFSFANPHCNCQMLKMYGCSFYGSPLLDLYSAYINWLYTSWNVALRTLCDLPYREHTRYLDHVSGLLHVKHIFKATFSFHKITTKHSNAYLIY